MTMVRICGRNGDPQPRVQAVIGDVLADVRAPRVLEAGCGSMSRIAPGSEWTMVGIDISARQLERNVALHEKIQGDLQKYRWESPSFDLIVCWDVIEHLDEPTAALTNLAGALKPGGVIVLAFPNFWSLKGWVTKLTPFRAHAWFYQCLLGDRRRTEDLDQFPTSFRYAIAPSRLRALCTKLGLEIVYEEIYEGPVQCHMRRSSRLADFGFAALGLASRLITLGRTDIGLSDCIFIARRQQCDDFHMPAGEAAIAATPRGNR